MIQYKQIIEGLPRSPLRKMRSAVAIADAQNLEAKNMQQFYQEAPRQIPIAYSVDVLVVGSGPAGFAAAVNAARQGAKTLLAVSYTHLDVYQRQVEISTDWISIEGSLDADGNLVIEGDVLTRVETATYVPGMYSGGMESELEGEWIHESGYILLSFDGKDSVSYQVTNDEDNLFGAVSYTHLSRKSTTRTIVRRSRKRASRISTRSSTTRSRA